MNLVSVVIIVLCSSIAVASEIPSVKSDLGLTPCGCDAMETTKRNERDTPPFDEFSGQTCGCKSTDPLKRSRRFAIIQAQAGLLDELLASSHQVVAKKPKIAVAYKPVPKIVHKPPKGFQHTSYYVGSEQDSLVGSGRDYYPQEKQKYQPQPQPQPQQQPQPQPQPPYHQVYQPKYDSPAPCPTIYMISCYPSVIPVPCSATNY